MCQHIDYTNDNLKYQSHQRKNTKFRIFPNEGWFFHQIIHEMSGYAKKTNYNKIISLKNLTHLSLNCAFCFHRNQSNLNWCISRKRINMTNDRKGERERLKWFWWRGGCFFWVCHWRWRWLISTERILRAKENIKIFLIIITLFIIAFFLHLTGRIAFKESNVFCD